MSRSTCPYHRFVKTTPKPNATKNSSGELVGPPDPELDMVGDGTAEVVETEVWLWIGVGSAAILDCVWRA